MSKPAYQRKIRNLIINPKFQLRYIMWVTASGFVLVSVNALVIYHYIRENYLTLVDLSPMTDEAKVQLYSELHQFIYILSAISFAFILITAILGFLFSHRTAGPLFHFKRVFEEIKNGNSKLRVRLRPKDEFRDVADSFNQMMDTLQK